MRLSRAQWRRSLATRPALILIVVVLLALSVSSAFPQTQSPQPPMQPQVQPGTLGLPNPPEDMRDLPRVIVNTHDDVNQRNATKPASEHGKTPAETEATCLLPPLSRMSSPTVAVGQLQRAARARNEYQQGCAALRKKKRGDAEKHFRKALREYRKYATAWVTLGQVLAAQEQTAEARHACLQASIAEPSYVAAYLCLADIAARAHSWDEVLRLSGRALELDPSANAIAYEYHAAANLNLRHLAAAEKSGLRALQIDRDHREPRVHFVLAQIYEAKGDSANEAVQLREYLRYSDSAPDAAMLEQFLSNLERQNNGIHAVITQVASGPDEYSSMREWEPPDIDASLPPVLSNGDACPLLQILQGTSSHTLELIESMRRFSASEYIEQVDIDKNGKRRNSSTQTVNYVAEIQQNSSGYPSIQEYRSGAGATQNQVMDFGGAVFALIFHPSHIGNFEFRCEGLTDLQGLPVWQLHFLESNDSNRSFAAIRNGGSITLTRFKGRAWITSDSYDVLRIETDLVSPVAPIDLQREHQIITYAPVEFPSRHTHLWLPDSTSLYIAYRGHRYERVHTFTEFQLFSVESTEAVKEPVENKAPQFFF
jgi:tetratricopeptide (TPR) repeat protein